MDKVLLIDGHNFMWRANVGFKPPTKPATPEQKKSEEFIIVFNFFRNLRPLIEQFSPDKCFFVLEGHPQFRYDLYAEYKANRKIIKTGAQQESKDKFYQNKDLIIQLLKHLPITLARAEKYECDDVIATLVEDMKDEDLTIVSNDSDFIQLLQKGYSNLKIYNPYKKDYVSAPEYHYLAWKCLTGDTSDNISGMMGDKTAQKTIMNPEKFDKFLSVEENRAKFSINKQLIEFRAVPLEEIVLEEGTGDFETLKQEFAKMEFNSIINDKSWAKYVDTFKCLEL